MCIIIRAGGFAQTTNIVFHICETDTGMIILKKLLATVLCGAALIVASVTRGNASELAVVARASDSALVQLKTALHEQDSGILSALFTENGSIITANGYQVSGRFRIRMAAKMAMLSGDNGELTAVRDSISAFGDSYRETGSYTFRVIDEDKADEDKATGKVFTGHYRILWSKEDSAWKIKQAVGLK